jgi:hypothetical protein
MLKDAPTRNGHAPADGPARSWRVARTVRPARATRRLGRAPGTAAAVGLLLLAAVGVKATLAPRAVSRSAPRAPGGRRA